MINKTIFSGDSILRYKKNKKVYDWTQKFLKLLSHKQKTKSLFKTYSTVGLNSNDALKKIPKILQKDKNIKNFIIQLGINDSWHYKSLKGKANVSKNKFNKNLNKIYIQSKKFKVNKIIFLTYHKLLNHRMEINKKTLNQNLYGYIKTIKNFCKKKKILCIDIFNETKNINPRDFCLKLPDGIHLNKHGTQIYARIVYKKIKKFI